MRQLSSSERLLGQVLVCVALFAPWTGLFAANTESRPPRPEWCRPGFVCVSVAEVAADTKYKIDLAERLAVAEAKTKRRLDWHIGCGPGIGFTVNTEWDAKAAPVPLMCGVFYGW